jgi:hypothetical protein
LQAVISETHLNGAHRKTTLSLHKNRLQPQQGATLNGIEIVILNAVQEIQNATETVLMNAIEMILNATEMVSMNAIEMIRNVIEKTIILKETEEEKIQDEEGFTVMVLLTK